jgi:hypothetical protein
MRDRETRYLSLRGEMNRLFDDFLHGFDDPLLSSTRPDALREFVPNVAVRAVA